MESLEKHFLIASPYMLDPNFQRTVVLMVQHSEEGAFGLVINRPTDKLLKDLWREINSSPCDSEEPVHLGGPVPGPIMAIHTDPELGDKEIIPGVYFTLDNSAVDRLVRQQEHRYKVFVGHSGWGPGQLEREMKVGAWLTLPATAEYCFHDQSEIWSVVTHAIGRDLLVTGLGLKRFPHDPTVN